MKNVKFYSQPLYKPPTILIQLISMASNNNNLSLLQNITLSLVQQMRDTTLTREEARAIAKALLAAIPEGLNEVETEKRVQQVEADFPALKKITSTINLYKNTIAEEKKRTEAVGEAHELLKGGKQEEVLQLLKRYFET